MNFAGTFHNLTFRNLFLGAALAFGVATAPVNANAAADIVDTAP